MINGKKVLAVIQARGGSKGIPLKNIYPLSNHPLISYTIYSAKKSKYIDDLIVSTDSKKIKKVALEYSAKVPFMRPKKLSGDKVTSVDSLFHAVYNYENLINDAFNFIIELPCVSPFRTGVDIDNALEKLEKTKADSVISVCNTGEKHPIRLKRIKNDQIKDFTKEFPEPSQGSRRQDLESCFIRNGAIYSMTRDILIKHKSRHGNDSRPYEMPIERSINIDEKFDLKITELLINSGNCDNKPWKLITDKKISNRKYKNQKILITTPVHYIPNFHNKLLNNKNIYFNSELKKKDLINIIPNIQAWICSPCPDYKINKEILKYADNLKIISSPSTGLSHIDTEYCNSKNIQFKNISSNKKINNITASSEFTFGLILNLVRNISLSSSSVLTGKWREEEDLLRSIQFNNKIIGIIGLGRIGKNIAKYSLSMGMKPYYYDILEKKISKDIVKCGSLEEILKISDIVVVCVKLNKKTNKMIGKKQLSMMKKNSFFINTSRGEVIDEKELIKFLLNKRIKGAALDVISYEQTLDTSNNALIQYSRKYNNLIITPHIAGLTYESEEIAAEIAFENLKSVKIE